MQLKQESNTDFRKRYHLVTRLRKAVKHTLHLEYICQSPLCDARTKLEAQAYLAFMRGMLNLELKKWEDAEKELLDCKNIYEKLSSALNEDEQVIYKQQVEELNPYLGFCDRNIGDSREKKENLLNMCNQGGNTDLLVAQTREKQVASLLEVTWRSRTVPVRHEKIRVFLLAFQGLENSLTKAADSDGQVSVYDTILLDCKEAVQSLKEELQASATASKQKGDVSTQLNSQQYLLNYLTFLRATLTIDRNLVMIEAFKKNFAANQVLININFNSHF